MKRFSRDALLATVIAEEYSSGGETLVTATARGALSRPQAFGMRVREDLKSFCEIHAALSGPPPRSAAVFTPETVRFPLEFSVELYEQLQHIDDPTRGALIVEGIRDRWQVTRSVAILEIGSGALSRPFDILNSAALSATAAALLEELVPTHAEVITDTRGVILLTFEHGQDALGTTLALAHALSQRQQEVRAGIDRGPILPVPDGVRFSVLGSAVNLASEQAHELGRPGHVLITTRAAGGLKLPPGRQRYRGQVSGVDLEGFAIPLGA